MARITVEDCIDKFESRFELVLVASNRARKLHSGETPTIERNNDKNTVIALREIADETIKIDDMKNDLIEEYQTVSLQEEEDLSLEYSDSDKNDFDLIKNDDKLETTEDTNLDYLQESTLSENEENNLENDESIDKQDADTSENSEDDSN